MPTFWAGHGWPDSFIPKRRHLFRIISHFKARAFMPTSSTAPFVQKVFYAGGLPLSCIPVPERWNN